MEWINPKYADAVAVIRQRQADAPAQQCGCMRIEPAGTSNGTCPACNGAGVRPAGFRSFITT
jgi:hypothetical protein